MAVGLVLLCTLHAQAAPLFLPDVGTLFPRNCERLSPCLTHIVQGQLPLTLSPPPPWKGIGRSCGPDGGAQRARWP